MTSLLDAHVHFWDPEARHHDWLASLPALRRRFGPEDLRVGPHELTGAIVVQADCRPDEALDEVLWFAELAARCPAVRGIVAYAPLHRGAGVEDHLAALSAEPLVVGVRRVLQGHPTAAFVDPALVAGLRLLPEFDLTFDLCVGHAQLPLSVELVRSCPETAFVLDHLGKPPVADGQLEPWRSDLERLAACPNVSCKLSGLTTEARPRWTHADVRPYLDQAVSTFGPDRCMFASDWPVVTLRTSYETWADTVLDAISGLAPADRQAVLHGTAARIYRLRPRRVSVAAR